MKTNLRADIIIEAVRFSPEGNITIARGYLRRGQTFSDSVLLTRKNLVVFAQEGKRIVTGKRVVNLASTFTDIRPVHIVSKEGKQYFSNTRAPMNKDEFPGIPVI